MADTPTTVPTAVQDRIDRGRPHMQKKAPKRRLFYKFWRGETYWYVNGKGSLVAQDTTSWAAGGQMPDQRIRNSYPFIASIVQAKVSAATQRVPGYEVVPSTTEPDDAQAAQLAEKVSLYGYDAWRLRRATTQWVEHAFVGGEGFVYPYFDNTHGPFVQDEETGEWVAEGDIRCLVLSGNEVYWEPGVEFDESRWYVIEQAVPKDVLKDTPGFLAADGELTGDATDIESTSDSKPPDLVLRREYLERPCPSYPLGRRLVMANGRKVLPEEPYPVIDHKGEVQDEPPLVRLSYVAETDDRDRGLVELLVDLQRTINDCWNKLLEWKNRCLNPQMIAPRGSNMARRDDTVGATWFYTPVGGQKPEWEKPPAIPRELFDLLDKAIEHVRAIAADIDVQADPDVTARTVQAAIEESRLRWQSFLGDLAEGHSRVMRRCLTLVQRHYTEPRLIKIMGLFGPDLTPGFMGADLMGQADARVSPDSLLVKSRRAVVEEAVLYFDKGWISGHAAMATINGGIGEKLSQAWALDVGRANSIIQTIKRGEDAVMSLRRHKCPPGFEDQMADFMDERGMVPGWMPRQFDNVDIHIEVFETWMKTAEWERLPDQVREVGELIYEALVAMRQQREIQEAMKQQAMAEGLGMANAAAPQGPKPMPDQRGLAPESQMPSLDGNSA